MDERIKTIANHYGLIHQLHKLLEEVCELKKATDGFLNNRDNLDHLQEEIADVRIMIAQVEYLLGMDSVIRYYVSLKLDRQIKRIENEKTELSNKN